MRESNFAFPAQNRACVCITSQLYDRRALDTTSPLPLFNSLTHLTYLTSTSPRIREIMTMDGGLERLVRILHEFCMCPPPPDNPAVIYGLSPPGSRLPKLAPTLNPPSFDKHAAYRFSLAFQCVVNIGVRGSEPIRSRVVQAGTLNVVGCILEAWLANKGFAVGPSSSATGMPRETKEQRHARRLAQQEQRQREEAAVLERALQRTISMQRRLSDDESNGTSPSSTDVTDHDTSTENSAAATPIRSNTPTGTVTVPSRDRSGTIIARTDWDNNRHQRRVPASPSPSTDQSRPETETEDDGDADGDVDMDRSGGNVARTGSVRSRTVAIISDEAEATPLQVDADAHIIINEDGVRGEDGAVGVEDGIVSLENNDDFAMGAPPGAPGAIDETTAPRVARRATIVNAPDVTPRAGLTTLPAVTDRVTGAGHHRNATIRGRVPTVPATNTATPTPTRLTGRTSSGTAHHHRDNDSGPYRDEDVLLSLQLLAYLSKYPHVRQAFYKPCVTFHPASANLPNSGRYSSTAGTSKSAISSGLSSSTSAFGKDATHGFFKAFTSVGRGKEKEKAAPPLSSECSSDAACSHAHSSPIRQTNVFSLVERFTFRPSSTESEMPNPPPKLPMEIQYWAGVIMRNACRKDDSRGGIRQCANMLCGRWESFPREFAKCRRCRKAKYCGKECQSTAWSEGHRFWCSAKDADEDPTTAVAGPSSTTGSSTTDANVSGTGVGVAVTASGTVTGRRAAERERRAERERQQRERAMALVGLGPTPRPEGTIPAAPELSTSSVIASTTSTGTIIGTGPSRDRAATIQPQIRMRNVQPSITSSVVSSTTSEVTPNTSRSTDVEISSPSLRLNSARETWTQPPRHHHSSAGPPLVEQYIASLDVASGSSSGTSTHMNNGLLTMARLNTLPTTETSDRAPSSGSTSGSSAGGDDMVLG